MRASKAPLCIAGLFLLVLSTGCSSPANVSDYFADRGRDALDVVALAFGIGPAIYVEGEVRGFVDVPVGFAGYGDWYALIEGRFQHVETRGVWGVPISNFMGWVVTWGNPAGLLFTKLGPGQRSILFFGQGLMGDELPWHRWLDVGGELSVFARVRASVSIGEAVDLLLGIACIDIADDDGLRPDSPETAVVVEEFRAAVWRGDLRAVEAMLKKHRGLATGKWQPPRYSPPIHVATHAKQHEVACLLIRYGATPDVYDLIELGMRDRAMKLIRRRPAVLKESRSRGTPLHWAAARDDVELVRFILKREPNLVHWGGIDGTPLQWAAGGGAKRTAQVLIDAGAPLHTDASRGISTTPLHWAARRQDTDMIEFFLAKGVKLEEGLSTETPLHEAAEFGSVKVAAFLLDKGIDVNAGGSKSPLHRAAEAGNLPVAKLLIARGANVNAGRSTTPLHKAAWRGHVEVMRLLLDNGANVNAGDTTTPLHYAAKWARVEAVRLLIARGANVNALDHSGTPLHYAAKWARVEAVKILLENGADVSIKNGAGVTALDLAEEWQKTRAGERGKKIVNLLTAHVNKEE